jgi:methionyl-tRNA formyltransferase
MTPLKAVFMGTSDFAVPSLLALDDPETKVVLVVTQPDRPAGRHLEPKPSPVKKAALERGWEVFQPEKARQPEAFDRLKSAAPDLVVVAAYGQILPKTILDLPTLACINVHASLLPRWRGAAPIHYAVMEGDAETGVTLMHVSEKLDEGDAILTRTVPIEPLETTGVLHDRLSTLGASALREAVELLRSGKAPRTPQNHSLATYAPSLKREHCRLDWKGPARKAFNKVRGLDPWPSAESVFEGMELKLFGASPAEGNGRPGEILRLEPEGVVVAACDGAVRIAEIQPPGKRRMKARDFSLGHAAFKPGAVLS